MNEKNGDWLNRVMPDGKTVAEETRSKKIAVAVMLIFTILGFVTIGGVIVWQWPHIIFWLRWFF